MSLRSTRIHTADDSVVSFPNGELMNQSISNSNIGETNCQVVAEIYLPITINTKKVRNIATEVAKLSQFIYLAKPITIIFVSDMKYDKLCYKMRLKAYVMDIRYEFVFKSELTEKVIKNYWQKNFLQIRIRFKKLLIIETYAVYFLARACRMNFTNMPELHYKYFILLFIVFVVGVEKFMCCWNYNRNEAYVIFTGKF